MTARAASLSDKFDLAETHLLLNGMQAIVRLVLMQQARDRRAGLKTAGYVTGYRGSPIAGIEAAFAQAGPAVTGRDIVFQPAVNEDLAATAVWGSQQAELRGEGRFDGVFAVWYGKGPGVDRSGDALRHANHAGTSRHGGVVALMGDDHTCESSTSAHQSEFAFIDALIPILAPTDVQELIDFGLAGFALSRYAGVWVGLKCVKDNAESSSTVDGRLDRMTLQAPPPGSVRMPADGQGLNIRRTDTPLAKEARWHSAKRDAIHAFIRHNRLDRLVLSGGTSPRIGILAAGKSYADVREALSMLAIDAARGEHLGLRLMKPAMTWPLEPDGLRRFADGLDLVIVVEEKRAVIEPQVKELLYHAARKTAVIGKEDEAGRPLFSPAGALDPLDIALAIARRVLAMHEDTALAARLASLEARAAARAATEPEPFSRTAYFCAGCPHNTSTRVPEGARAYAGIGCHYMAQWMDRSTEGFTQMGGEGAGWIGEAPFSKRPHVFQNIGDGTYVHSGSLAIRAAAAAGTAITFKILYNDAVAMTGGQPLEGNLSVAQMAAGVLADGAARVAIVTDDPARYRGVALPAGVPVHPRRELASVERTLAAVPATTVLIYDQTCATEKRRRRKRGLVPDPGQRVHINPLVCEGCGDCGRKSNCVAILPRETELGRRREIDQSACNRDLSCLDGFCPSFVTLTGAEPRRRLAREAAAAQGDATAVLPEPSRPALDRPYAVLATGIGGTGVVTISAILGQAAHLAGLAFGGIDVTGLAQKGGAVVCHMRFAASPGDLAAIRVPASGADLVLGGDLVVTASAKVLDTIDSGRTRLLVSSHVVPTGDFTRDPGHSVPASVLKARIDRAAGSTPPNWIDAQALAVAELGDSIFANMILTGLASQKGLLPVPPDAIEKAIALNATAVAANIAAFRLGRRLALGLAAAPASPEAPEPVSLDEIVDRRAAELEAYQDRALADRYRSAVASLAAIERARTPGRRGLAEAVARGYYRVLAVKDEYEVARLFTDGRFEAEIAGRFEGTRGLTFHFAPAWLARRDRATGEPRKIAIPGRLVLPLLRRLARMRHWRGTWADPFRFGTEHRRARAWIATYEGLLRDIACHLSPATHETACALARLGDEVAGFGHVKLASLQQAEARLLELKERLTAAPVRAAAE